MRRIIAFRNRLIQGYASVANDIVWNALENDLPILRQQVEAILAERDCP